DVGGRSFYDVDGLTQASYPYPIVPKVVKPIPVSTDQIAKGAVLIGGTVNDETGFKVAFANATADSSNIDPTGPTDVTYPAALQSIGTFFDANGDAVQKLVVLPGLFRPDDNASTPAGTGTMRTDPTSAWRVYYGSPSSETDPPQFTQVRAVP